MGLTHLCPPATVVLTEPMAFEVDGSFIIAEQIISFPGIILFSHLIQTVARTLCFAFQKISLKLWLI